MRYPHFLPENGTIGFIAPSFGCSTEPYKSAFDNAQKKFAEKGYRCVCGPNAYKGTGIGISAAPRECAEEFMEAWESRESDVIISCGGGELMCEILEHIDFERVKQAPAKWFQGYSDNTNLTFLLTTLCDTAAVYGPCAPSFGMEPWHESLEDAMGILTGKKWTEKGYLLYETESLKDEEHPLVPYNCTQKRVIRSFVGKKDASGLCTAEQTEEAAFSGRLIGGCMDCLVNLTGTSFDRVSEFAQKYRDDGFIWFLEACDLSVFAIRRAIWEMIHAGWFQHVKGFLIGRPLCSGQEMMGLDQYNAVTDLLSRFEVPVIMDLDIGHLPPQMPLVSGALADVNVKEQEFSIRMRQ